MNRHFDWPEMEEASPATAKQAEDRYRFVLKVCNGGDSCSYSHYRIAWILKKQENIPAAIDEMKLALLDSKGQYRNESVRDLISFMGQDTRAPKDNIAFVEELSSKMGQPKVLQDLAFAYLTGANKSSGVEVLEVVNARQPTIGRELRLLEEIYGVRDWARFQSHLSSLEHLSKDPAQLTTLANADEATELEKIAKRMAIQLDGERVTSPERSNDYKAFSLVALDLFPKAKDNRHLMEGWVAAEQDVGLKLAQLKDWENSDRFGFSNSDKLQLHELRVGIAQKQKIEDVVIEEMTALIPLAPTPAKAQEYQYALAHALYDKKDFVQALPLFQAIAAAALQNPQSVSSLQIQSQNLALDILNQQKNYEALEAQSKLWTDNSGLKQNAKVAGDLKEMSEVHDQAAFEQAVSLKETPAALAQFRAFCEGQRYLPQSCDNAKTLSIKLGQHADLVAVLKVQAALLHSSNKVLADKASLAAEELAAELEIGGYFSESAKAQEVALTKKKTSLLSWIKVALDFELGGDLVSRDRVFAELLKTATKNRGTAAFDPKPTEAEELALADALRDAKLLTPAWVQITGFSHRYQIRTADGLELTGHGNAATKKMLLSETSPTGAAWSKVITDEAIRLDEKQKSIHFYGRNGERQFQARLATLKQLNDFVVKMLPASTSESRITLLRISKGASDLIANEILGSPIPEKLSAEQKAGIKSSLEELAKPFQDRSVATNDLMNSEVAKAQDPALKSKLEQMATADLQSVLADQKSERLPAEVTDPKVVASATAPALQQLKQNPRDGLALASLRDTYRSFHQERLALYFENRLAQVNKETAK